jgi:2-iminobutanoate/2-iminopropanoate deaminase
LIFVSGHSAPHDPVNGIDRGATPGEQVRNAITAIDSILRVEGSSLQRVVQVTMLITDPENYAACNEEYVKHFPEGLPARHTARFGVPTEAMVGFFPALLWPRMDRASVRCCHFYLETIIKKIRRY